MSIILQMILLKCIANCMIYSMVDLLYKILFDIMVYKCALIWHDRFYYLLYDLL